VRIVRARHPLEGRSLELIGWMRRRRRLELIVVLGDGSRLLVPAAWTDLVGAVGSPVAGTLGSVSDLLAMRGVLDGVLRAALAGEPADGRGVVLAGRDDPVDEERSGAVASISGGVTGAGGGAVGAGGLRAAPGGDRAERRGRGGER
jgi:hypothetical protein